MGEPTFTYAHTLCGHEMVSNEDLEKAITAFRNALRYDGRHYNALYGLGAIYYRQEKYDKAEAHFKQAININPMSSVLQCYLGMVLHTQAQQISEDSEANLQEKERKTRQSLRVLTEACKIDPYNPQLRFQKVHVLLSLKCDEDALEDLEIVRDLAPREPPVYSLLGQICYRVGKINEALKHFNTAIDLDPKGEAGALKAALEGEEEVEDEAEERSEEREVMEYDSSIRGTEEGDVSQYEEEQGSELDGNDDVDDAMIELMDSSGDIDGSALYGHLDVTSSSEGGYDYSVEATDDTEL